MLQNGRTDANDMVIVDIVTNPQSSRTDGQLCSGHYQLTPVVITYSPAVITYSRRGEFFSPGGATRETVSCCRRKVSVDRSTTVFNYMPISIRQ